MNVISKTLVKFEINVIRESGTHQTQRISELTVDAAPGGGGGIKIPMN